MNEPIEHILTPDGGKRVTIYRWADGFFECSFDTFCVNDPPEYIYRAEGWVTQYVWGIYDIIVVTRREAAAK